ncbi:MAG: hypothetical protein LBU37_13380 [Tannerellaceae bacterium]|jgi:hypothetical protein|nr:hypothetical protein [Tannerellaceae bacterium]
MISTGDIKNILLRDVKANPALGMIAEIEKDGHAPVTETSVAERIVIVLPGGMDNGPISRAFPRICVYVPDDKINRPKGSRYYKPGGKRLNQLENECIRAFRSGVYGTYGEEVYTYKLEDIVQESDPDTWSHFLNVRLRFEAVNTKL